VPDVSVGLVVPAGGMGARIGTRTPKPFLRLGRTTILDLTLRRFQNPPLVHRIVVAVPSAHVAPARRLARPNRRPLPTIVMGGPTRQESVWQAMQALEPDTAIVVVHDAVRPFVTRPLVMAVIAAAREHGAALCALPIAETVKRVRGGLVVETVDRTELWTVQTPQAFHHALLREAHEKARRDGVVGTDDAMLVERLGHPVRVVPGLAENIKITTPADLRRARAWGRP